MAAMVVLSACGAGGPEAAADVASLEGGATTTPAGDTAGDTGGDDEVTQEERQEAMLAFAQCMRDHGIDMPDPQFNEDGGATLQGGPGGAIDPDDPDFQAAEEACRADMPGFRTQTKRAGEDG